MSRASFEASPSKYVPRSVPMRPIALSRFVSSKSSPTKTRSWPLHASRAGAFGCHLQGAMLETVRTFAALSEEFVELFAKHHPVEATRLGIHDYDARLPDDSPAGLRERDRAAVGVAHVADVHRDHDQALVAVARLEAVHQRERIDALRAGRLHEVHPDRLAAHRREIDRATAQLRHEQGGRGLADMEARLSGIRAGRRCAGACRARGGR